MSKTVIHCPLCDATTVAGLGALRREGVILVEFRCRQCGELFYVNDKRATGNGQQTD